MRIIVLKKYLSITIYATRVLNMTSAIGDRIAEARQRAGLSQAELGQVADVAQTQISRYESGRAVPRRAVLARLAEALRVPLEWLSFGEGPTEAIRMNMVEPDGNTSTTLVIPESLTPWVQGMAEGLECSIPDAVVEIIRQHQSLRMSAPTGNAAYPVAGMLAAAVTDLELRMKNLEAELAEAIDERHKLQEEVSELAQSKKP